MALRLVPMTLRAANAFVSKYHRHNKVVQGCKFCLGAKVGDYMEAVAIVGRPVSRRLDDGFTAEVLRVCVRPPYQKNACSFLYGACWRVWREMGGHRILTYTLTTESGASMRAVGWTLAAEVEPPKGKGWLTREGREDQAVVRLKKYRWEQCATHLK